MARGVYVRTKYHNKISKKNGFKKGHKSFRTKESYRKVGKKLSKALKGNPLLMGNHSKTEFKKGTKAWELRGDFNSGKKHWNYIDGRSKEKDPYPIDWTDTLKESVRQRDSYVCQICGTHQDELDGWMKVLDVHHIDYNKKNCNPDNLITLCRSCHVKTNKNRGWWTKYFLT